MATIVATITETLRYRGKIGQWSWVLHRASGLGVVIFLILHVVDTSWAAFYPELYAKAIAAYQSPLFTVGEFGLVAAVVYHAINGVRIVILDWRPKLWHLQQRAALAVFGIVGLILVPTFALMFDHVLHFYDRDPEVMPVNEVLQEQLQFALGFIVIVVVAVGLSLLVALLSGESLSTRKQRLRRASSVDVWFWKFMRISGILILPLVFGHLAMVHIIQGVFDMTVAGAPIVGTDMVNESGKAVEFVGKRWDYLVAGVAVWRLYDGALLGLVVLHGFYGLYLIANDYIHNKVINRAANWMIVFGAGALIILGSAALLAGVEETAYAMLIETIAAR
ncbi:MAG: succinate dehydrogenase, cytochrome b556 subunit [Anaerolineae bacterium]|nr:succinate dehydrogenase, cytochrome b556 subunit [Anaerolineae bacterium]